MKHCMMRRVLALCFSMLFAVSLLAGCGGVGGGPTSITLYIGGDVNIKNLWNNILIPEFEKSHQDIKVKLVFSEHGTNDSATAARITAAANQNRSADIDLIESGAVTQLASAKLLTPLTKTEIPQLDRIDSVQLNQVNSMAVPYRASSVVLAYDSAVVKDPPSTLNDLISWIKANPGKFTYNTPDSGGSGQAFVRAVINSQVPADKQEAFITGYDASMEDLWKPGLQTLKDIQPAVYRNGFHPTGNVGTLQLLGNGSIAMAPVWSDQSLDYLQKKLLPATVKLVQLTPPFSGGPAYIGIPKGSEHAKEAETLLNWLLNTDVQVKVMNAVQGYPGIAWSYIPDDAKAKYQEIARSYATGYSFQFNADMNKAWSTQVVGG